MRRSHHHRPGAIVTAALAGIALAVSLAVPAQATDGTGGTGGTTDTDGPAHGIPVREFAAQKVSPSLRDTSGQVSVYVQFTGEGAFEQTQPDAVKEGKADPVVNRPLIEEIRNNISSQAESVASETGASTLYTTTNTLPGVAIVGGADIDTRAVNTWTERTQTGKGITIAVLDTGIDNTHSDFGGPGTAEAYAAAQASLTIPAADSGLITVTVANPGTRQAKVEVTSQYGSARVNKLNPGQSRTVVITTRQSSIMAGEVTVDYTYTGKGKPGETSVTAAFDAQQCGKPGNGNDGGKPGHRGGNGRADPGS